MDKTQFDTVYAILEHIRVAAGDQAHDMVDRLAHAAQCVMTGLSVEDERNASNN